MISKALKEILDRNAKLILKDPNATNEDIIERFLSLEIDDGIGDDEPLIADILHF